MVEKMKSLKLFLITMAQASIIAWIFVLTLEPHQWDGPGLIIISIFFGIALTVVDHILIFPIFRKLLKIKFKTIFKMFKTWWKETTFEDLSYDHDNIFYPILILTIVFLFGNIFMLFTSHIFYTESLELLWLSYGMRIISFGGGIFIIVGIWASIYEKYWYKIENIYSKTTKRIRFIYNDYKILKKGFKNDNEKISYYLNKEERSINE